MNVEAVSIYRDLLTEIKYRVETINLVLARRVAIPAKAAEELCYLQLRMICEIIALGCLVIHRDLDNLKPDLFRTYKAGRIIKELGTLHGKFFPVPLESSDDQTKTPLEWVHKKSGFLTRDELLELWSRHCGEALHRGSVRNVFEKRKEPEFGPIERWRDKIIGLLNRHIILSSDEEKICYFIMADKNNDHRVGSNIFDKIP